jgi:hypothetical protein
MKLLLLLALAAPTRPLKPWTRDMCEVRQAYATDDYLTYCRIASPGKHPDCPVKDPTGYANQAAREDAEKRSHGKGADFEFWDCSWHARSATRK